MGQLNWSVVSSMHAKLFFSDTFKSMICSCYLKRMGGNMDCMYDSTAVTLDKHWTIWIVCLIQIQKGHSHSAGNLWLQRTALWENGNRVDRPILDKMSLSAGHNNTDAPGLLSPNADPSAKTVYPVLCLHHQCLLFHTDLLLGCHFFVSLFTQWFCNGANIWQQST